MLLDTHAFLRWTTDSPLPRPVRQILSKSSTECFVSIVTEWEIILKPKLGSSMALIESARDRMGAALLQIQVSHLHELSRLGFPTEHRDPFDRMLIAQALAEDLALISGDTQFAQYKNLRVIWD